MKDESIKMEFLLTLNDNIVVQRYFNVKNYNYDAKNSNEYHELIEKMKKDIELYLKNKSIAYLVENQTLITYDPTVMETSNTDGPEVFNMYIKEGDNVISHISFDGKVYPPKVRYTVDIREYLKNTLKDMSEVLSNDDLNYQYLDLDLRTRSI